MTTRQVAAKGRKGTASKGRTVRKANRAQRAPLPMSKPELTAKAKRLTGTSRLVNLNSDGPDTFKVLAEAAIKAQVEGTANWTRFGALLVKRYNFDWIPLARMSANDALVADKEHGARVNVDRKDFYSLGRALGLSNIRTYWMLSVKYAEQIRDGKRDAITGKVIRRKPGAGDAKGAKPGGNARSDLVRAQAQLIELYTWTAKRQKAKELDARVAPIVKLVAEALTAIGTNPKTIKLS